MTSSSPDRPTKRACSGKASGGHAGHGVDLEHEELAAILVPAVVGADYAAASEMAIGAFSPVAGLKRDVLRNVGRQHMLGAARRVFRVEIIEATFGLISVTHAPASRTDIAARAPEYRLGDQFGIDVPLASRRRLAVGLDDDDADTEPSLRGLITCAPVKSAGYTWLSSTSSRSAGTAMPTSASMRLGTDLVHGVGRGEKAAVGVGDVHDVEQPLDVAILADLAVQRVEHTRRLHLGQGGGDIPGRADLDGIPSGITRRLAAEAGGDTADARLDVQPPIRTATRSPVTRRLLCQNGSGVGLPVGKRTHARISSAAPGRRAHSHGAAWSRRASRSCAEASPVLIRKLQCFSKPGRRRPQGPGIRRIDFLPGLAARRIGKGAAAGAHPTWLRIATAGDDFLHALLDGGFLAGARLQFGMGEDPVDRGIVWR